MKKLKKFTAVLSVILLTAASIPIMTGCGSDSGQEYAWVLATASPEDTVTGLYAIKFAEESPYPDVSILTDDVFA